MGLRRARLVPILFSGARVPSGATLISDTFTGANNTAINGRAPTVTAYSAAGKTWTANANWTIQGNKAQYGSTTEVYAIIDVGVANYRAAVNYDSAVDDAAMGGLVVRYSDASNRWAARWAHGATDALQLYEINGGVATLRATTPLAGGTGQAFDMEVVCDGQNITLTVSATSATYASTFLQTQTQLGLTGKNNGDLFDNFEVKAL